MRLRSVALVVKACPPGAFIPPPPPPRPHRGPIGEAWRASLSQLVRVRENLPQDIS